MCTFSKFLRNWKGILVGGGFCLVMDCGGTFDWQTLWFLICCKQRYREREREEDTQRQWRIVRETERQRPYIYTYLRIGRSEQTSTSFFVLHGKVSGGFLHVHGQGDIMRGHKRGGGGGGGGHTSLTYLKSNILLYVKHIRESTSRTNDKRSRERER